MATGTRSAAYKHFKAVINRWPKDNLRPEAQFQDMLARRIADRFVPGKAVDEDHELRQVNALYSLLNDRYKNRYPIKGALLQPRSNPTYYADVIKELEEAPNRSWLGRLGKRLAGMIRFS